MAQASVTIKLSPREFDVVRDALKVAKFQYGLVADDKDSVKSKQYKAAGLESEIGVILKIFRGTSIE